jgi:hypothetical protein
VTLPAAALMSSLLLQVLLSWGNALGLLAP